jgi:hypothetical protein
MVFQSLRKRGVVTIFHQMRILGTAGSFSRDAWGPMEARRPVLVWMAAAFCTALALAICAMAIAHHRRLGVGLEVTARFAFLLFWPAYVGGALTSLFGAVFLPLKSHARELGLSFAAAIAVHLGLVATVCLVGQAPPLKTFAVFGAAVSCTYLLALLSVRRVRDALPANAWPPIRFVAMNYILYAFILDFRRNQTYDLIWVVKYLPFLALAISAPIFRIAAWAKTALRPPAKKGLPRQSP